MEFGERDEIWAAEYEIDRVRFLSRTNYLRAYAARAETWELLCLIFSLNGDRRFGINDYIDMIESARCSRLTMYKFLRDRIDGGDFNVMRGDKKSRKTLAPRKELVDEFNDYQTRLLDPRLRDLPPRVA